MTLFIMAMGCVLGDFKVALYPLFIDAFAVLGKDNFAGFIGL